MNSPTPLSKRLAWKLALACWTLRLDRLGNYFEDVRWADRSDDVYGDWRDRGFPGA